MRKYFITFLALLTVLAISCNNRPTQASDFTTGTTPITIDESTGIGELPAIDDTSAVNPVIAVNGDKIILAYTKGSDIQYRTSIDGGNTINKSSQTVTRAGVSSLGTPTSFGSAVSSPHVFFKSDDSVVIIATVGNGLVDNNSGSPVDAIRGTFATRNNSEGTSEGYINFTGKGRESVKLDGGTLQTGWKNLLISSSSTFEGLKDSGSVNVRTVAGAGRIANSTLILPIRAYKSQAVFGVELTSTDGVSWNSKTNSVIRTQATTSLDAKFKADGTTALTGTVDKSFESSKGSGSTEYSITADGKITSGSTTTQVGTGTVESSIAVLSDGTVVTFTKEASGLVFRKIPADKLNGTAIK